MEMTSNRPYLLRAIYEWLVDNNCTPHLVVFANVDQSQEDPTLMHYNIVPTLVRPHRTNVAVHIQNLLQDGSKREEGRE